MTDNAALDAMALENDARQGERAFRKLYDFLARFISYPSEHAHLAHALWCIYTHLMDRWESTPRLAFLSPEPGSGKLAAMSRSHFCTTKLTPSLGLRHERMKRLELCSMQVIARVR